LIAVLALPRDPIVVLLLGDRRETYVDIHLRSLEQQILHDEARLVRGGFEQYAHSQRTVDVGLSDVEDECVVPRQYLGQRRCHAGLVLARNIYLDYFDVVLHRVIEI